MEKKKRKIDKKKVIIVAVIAFAVLVLCIGGIIFAISKTTKPKLKNKEITLEYGQEIDISKLKLFEKECEVTDLSCDFKFKDENKYPEIGKYKLTGKYKHLGKNKNFEVTIVIKDTTPPKVIKSNEEIHVPFGNANFDFKTEFEAEDLSGCEISFDLSNVKFDVAGTYEAKAIFTDAYGNKTEQPFKVVVDEEGNHSYNLTYVRGILIVNKKHGLPQDYNPGEDPTALSALMQLISDAQNEGLDIGNSYSGFRSYSRQETLYWNYVNMDGQAAADTYSARPGFSEHQTGLAFDLCTYGGNLVESEPEATWIAQNADKYGFIVRYAPGKQSITGYVEEPWHLRYVGSVATDIYNSGLTLEEYLGVEGGDYY